MEIGKCSYVYDFPKDSSILNSSAAPSGVKSANTQGFTIGYSAGFDFAGKSYPSLKSALGASGANGLNSCLEEGKNFLRVTARDNARSDADGVNPVGNMTVYLSGNGVTNYTDSVGVPAYPIASATLNVDNAGPALKITGDASKVFESNAAPSSFLGGITLDPNWKNYTISGALLSGDPYGGVNAPKCQSFTSTGYACTVNGLGQARPSIDGIIWTAPA